MVALVGRRYAVSIASVVVTGGLAGRLHPGRRYHRIRCWSATAGIAFQFIGKAAVGAVSTRPMPLNQSEL
jgi:hypothetical protein